MNKTTMEHTRSMRLHVGFPLNMWVEVVITIVYLINRSPSAPLGCGILEEAWIGKRQVILLSGYSVVKHLLI